MVETKSRKPRKTKITTEQPEDQEMEPMSETFIEPKRKAPRKTPTKRLSRSSGMGDIASPTADEALAGDLVIEEEYLRENISIAGHAVHASNMHERTSIRSASVVPATPANTATDFSAAPVVVSTKQPEPEIKGVGESEENEEELEDGEDEKDVLAPSYNSFNLKQKKNRSGVATFFIWLLDIVIILGIIALFLLYKFPAQSQQWIGKVIPKYAPSQQSSSSSNSGSAQSNTSTTISYRTAAGNTTLAQAVNSGVTSAFSSYTIQSSADQSEVSPLHLTGDVLLYKGEAQSQATQINSYLSQQFGLNAKMQQDDSLQEDVLLSLAPTVTNPDLSNAVAVVYNASGKTGAAKQYCDTLLSYKAASCSAANATGNATGLLVSYKIEAQHFTLARSESFSSATFQLAPASQVQDIAVTIGK